VYACCLHLSLQFFGKLEVTVGDWPLSPSLEMGVVYLHHDGPSAWAANSSEKAANSSEKAEEERQGSMPV
jgi:hypothetical protein